jgi:ribose 5-phosphate isomerase RpiB
MCNMAKEFLQTSFEARHQPRIAKIKALENK